MTLDELKSELERLVYRNRFYCEDIKAKDIEDLLKYFPDEDEIYELWCPIEDKEELEEIVEVLQGQIEELEKEIEELKNENQTN